MKQFFSLSVVMIAMIVLSALLPGEASAEFKKTKIAVLDFTMQGQEYQTKDMGKIVAEWLITGLVETGRFDVIERRLLEKIMEEHALGASGAVDPESVAQLGKILGVKTIVSGTILSFEETVEINARLIAVDTASIIAAEKVRASSATRLNDLVNQIIEKIVQAFPLEGYVVMRADNRVTLDLGNKIGVKPNMKFIAFKEGKVIKHPKTGEVLDVETVEIGEIEIVEVREKTSTGLILKESMSSAIEYGTMVRSAIKGQLVHFEEQAPTKVQPPPQEPEQRPAPRYDQGGKKPKVNIPAPSF
jgi:TolB-like protein